MNKSSIPIIKHIPQFLDHCKKEGLSEKTQENYKRYLNKFISWLKEKKKNDILPHELTTADIDAYRLYLSSYKNEKGHSLKKISQNYYLIALRAILSYFIVKDIVSLLPDKIILPRGFRREKTTNFLNLDQVEKLLLAPNAKTQKGLRDKAILETLVSAGLKINQLTKLDRNQLKNIGGEVLPSLEKYLETRKDKNNALFINYRAKKSSIGERLTGRSIERIVKKYGRKINLPFLITPEILRWARAFAVLNKEIEIKETHNHQTLTIETYKNRGLSFVDRKKLQNLSPAWHNIENIINQEVTWLKGNIPVLPMGYKENPPFLHCDDCILRKIAILIISGKVKATEIKTKGNKDLWNGLTENMNFKKISRHGQGWHRKMMDVVSSYFRASGYTVNFEPILHYGRADLEVYKKLLEHLYIEIDTVSLFKLWYNLSVMENVTFLIIPSEDEVIEFNT